MNPHETEIVLSVSEINSALKSHIEPIFRNITIRGEVSNLKIQSSGHIYFSLIDKESLIQAVLFRSYALQSSHMIKNGDEILARGEISLYMPRGNYQLVVREIRAYGTGIEQIRLHLLKKKLLDLGWFRLERKRPIPLEWKTIGVITSPTGAVIQDIVSVLERRTENCFHLILNPVRVQGETAHYEIAAAIQNMNSYSLCDLILVCRGGGSSDDLMAFNSEVVASACFHSAIPIISAIGHETDTTIIDLVADIRAATPSIAAEIASQKRADTLQTLKNFKKSFFLAYAPFRLYEMHEQKLDDITIRINEFLNRLIYQKYIELHMKRSHLESINPVLVVKNNQKRFENIFIQIKKIITQKYALLSKESIALTERIFASIDRIVKIKKSYFIGARTQEILKNRLFSYWKEKKEKFYALQHSFSLINPKNPLEKGYAVIFRKKDASVIHSIASVEVHEHLEILMKDGRIIAQVESRIEKREQLH